MQVGDSPANNRVNRTNTNSNTNTNTKTDTYTKTKTNTKTSRLVLRTETVYISPIEGDKTDMTCVDFTMNEKYSVTV